MENGQAKTFAVARPSGASAFAVAATADKMARLTKDKDWNHEPPEIREKRKAMREIHENPSTVTKAIAGKRSASPKAFRPVRANATECSGSRISSISWLINVRILPRISAFFRVTGWLGLPGSVAVMAKAGSPRRLVRQSCSGDGGSAQREGGSKSVKVSQSDLIRVPRSVTLPRIEYE